MARIPLRMTLESFEDVEGYSGDTFDVLHQFPGTGLPQVPYCALDALPDGSYQVRPLDPNTVEYFGRECQMNWPRDPRLQVMVDEDDCAKDEPCSNDDAVGGEHPKAAPRSCSPVIVSTYSISEEECSVIEQNREAAHQSGPADPPNVKDDSPSTSKLAQIPTSIPDKCTKEVVSQLKSQPTPIGRPEHFKAPADATVPRSHPANNFPIVDKSPGQIQNKSVKVPEKDAASGFNPIGHSLPPKNVIDAIPSSTASSAEKGLVSIGTSQKRNTAPCSSGSASLEPRRVSIFDPEAAATDPEDISEPHMLKSTPPKEKPSCSVRQPILPSIPCTLVTSSTEKKAVVDESTISTDQVPIEIETTQNRNSSSSSVRPSLEPKGVSIFDPEPAPTNSKDNEPLKNNTLHEFTQQTVPSTPCSLAIPRVEKKANEDQCLPIKKNAKSTDIVPSKIGTTGKGRSSSSSVIPSLEPKRVTVFDPEPAPTDSKGIDKPLVVQSTMPRNNASHEVTQQIAPSAPCSLAIPRVEKKASEDRAKSTDILPSEIGTTEKGRPSSSVVNPSLEPKRVSVFHSEPAPTNTKVIDKPPVVQRTLHKNNPLSDVRQPILPSIPCCLVTQSTEKKAIIGKSTKPTEKVPTEIETTQNTLSIYDFDPAPSNSKDSNKQLLVQGTPKNNPSRDVGRTIVIKTPCYLGTPTIEKTANAHKSATPQVRPVPPIPLRTLGIEEKRISLSEPGVVDNKKRVSSFDPKAPKRAKSPESEKSSAPGRSSASYREWEEKLRQEEVAVCGSKAIQQIIDNPQPKSKTRLSRVRSVTSTSSGTTSSVKSSPAVSSAKTHTSTSSQSSLSSKHEKSEKHSSFSRKNSDFKSSSKKKVDEKSSETLKKKSVEKKTVGSSSEAHQKSIEPLSAKSSEAHQTSTEIPASKSFEKKIVATSSVKFSENFEKNVDILAAKSSEKSIESVKSGEDCHKSTDTPSSKSSEEKTVGSSSAKSSEKESVVTSSRVSEKTIDDPPGSSSVGSIDTSSAKSCEKSIDPLSAKSSEVHQKTTDIPSSKFFEKKTVATSSTMSPEKSEKKVDILAAKASEKSADSQSLKSVEACHKSTDTPPSKSSEEKTVGSSPAKSLEKKLVVTGSKVSDKSDDNPGACSSEEPVHTSSAKSSEKSEKKSVRTSSDKSSEKLEKKSFRTSLDKSSEKLEKKNSRTSLDKSSEKLENTPKKTPLKSWPEGPTSILNPTKTTFKKRLSKETQENAKTTLKEAAKPVDCPVSNSPKKSDASESGPSAPKRRKTVDSVGDLKSGTSPEADKPAEALKWKSAAVPEDPCGPGAIAFRRLTDDELLKALTGDDPSTSSPSVCCHHECILGDECPSLLHRSGSRRPPISSQVSLPEKMLLNQEVTTTKKQNHDGDVEKLKRREEIDTVFDGCFENFAELKRREEIDTVFDGCFENFAEDLLEKALGSWGIPSSSVGPAKSPSRSDESKRLERKQKALSLLRDSNQVLSPGMHKMPLVIDPQTAQCGVSPKPDRLEGVGATKPMSEGSKDPSQKPESSNTDLIHGRLPKSQVLDKTSPKTDQIRELRITSTEEPQVLDEKHPKNASEPPGKLDSTTTELEASQGSLGQTETRLTLLPDMLEERGEVISKRPTMLSTFSLESPKEESQQTRKSENPNATSPSTSKTVGKSVRTPLLLPLSLKRQKMRTEISSKSSIPPKSDMASVCSDKISPSDEPPSSSKRTSGIDLWGEKTLLDRKTRDSREEILRTLIAARKAPLLKVPDTVTAVNIGTIEAIKDKILHVVEKLAISKGPAVENKKDVKIKKEPEPVVRRQPSDDEHSIASQETVTNLCLDFSEPSTPLDHFLSQGSVNTEWEDSETQPIDQPSGVGNSDCLQEKSYETKEEELTVEAKTPAETIDKPFDSAMEIDDLACSAGKSSESDIDGPDPIEIQRKTVKVSTLASPSSRLSTTPPKRLEALTDARTAETEEIPKNASTQPAAEIDDDNITQDKDLNTMELSSEDVVSVCSQSPIHVSSLSPIHISSQESDDVTFVPYDGANNCTVISLRSLQPQQAPLVIDLVQDETSSCTSNRGGNTANSRRVRKATRSRIPADGTLPTISALVKSRVVRENALVQLRKLIARQVSVVCGSLTDRKTLSNHKVTRRKVFYQKYIGVRSSGGSNNSSDGDITTYDSCGTNQPCRVANSMHGTTSRPCTTNNCIVTELTLEDESTSLKPAEHSSCNDPISGTSFAAGSTIEGRDTELTPVCKYKTACLNPIESNSSINDPICGATDDSRVTDLTLEDKATSPEPTTFPNDNPTVNSSTLLAKRDGVDGIVELSDDESHSRIQDGTPATAGMPKPIPFCWEGGEEQGFRNPDYIPFLCADEYPPRTAAIASPAKQQSQESAPPPRKRKRIIIINDEDSNPEPSPQPVTTNKLPARRSIRERLGYIVPCNAGERRVFQPQYDSDRNRSYYTGNSGNSKIHRSRGHHSATEEPLIADTREVRTYVPDEPESSIKKRIRNRDISDSGSASDSTASDADSATSSPSSDYEGNTAEVDLRNRLNRRRGNTGEKDQQDTQVAARPVNSPDDCQQIHHSSQWTREVTVREIVLDPQFANNRPEDVDRSTKEVSLETSPLLLVSARPVSPDDSQQIHHSSQWTREVVVRQVVLTPQLAVGQDDADRPTREESREKPREDTQRQGSAEENRSKSLARKRRQRETSAERKLRKRQRERSLETKQMQKVQKTPLETEKMLMSIDKLEKPRLKSGRNSSIARRVKPSKSVVEKRWEKPSEKRRQLKAPERRVEKQRKDSSKTHPQKRKNSTEESWEISLETRQHSSSPSSQERSQEKPREKSLELEKSVGKSQDSVEQISREMAWTWWKTTEAISSKNSKEPLLGVSEVNQHREKTKRKSLKRHKERPDKSSERTVERQQGKTCRLEQAEIMVKELQQDSSETSQEIRNSRKDSWEISQVTRTHSSPPSSPKKSLSPKRSQENQREGSPAKSLVKCIASEQKDSVEAFHLSQKTPPPGMSPVSLSDKDQCPLEKVSQREEIHAMKTPPKGTLENMKIPTIDSSRLRSPPSVPAKTQMNVSPSSYLGSQLLSPKKNQSGRQSLQGSLRHQMPWVPQQLHREMPRILNWQMNPSVVIKPLPVLDQETTHQLYQAMNPLPQIYASHDPATMHVTINQPVPPRPPTVPLSTQEAVEEVASSPKKIPQVSIPRKLRRVPMMKPLQVTPLPEATSLEAHPQQGSPPLKEGSSTDSSIEETDLLMKNLKPVTVNPKDQIETEHEISPAPIHTPQVSEMGKHKKALLKVGREESAWQNKLKSGRRFLGRRLKTFAQNIVQNESATSNLKPVVAKPDQELSSPPKPFLQNVSSVKPRVKSNLINPPPSKTNPTSNEPSPIPKLPKPSSKQNPDISIPDSSKNIPLSNKPSPALSKPSLNRPKNSPNMSKASLVLNKYPLPSKANPVLSKSSSPANKSNLTTNKIDPGKSSPMPSKPSLASSTSNLTAVKQNLHSNKPNPTSRKSNQTSSKSNPSLSESSVVTLGKPNLKRKRLDRPSTDGKNMDRPSPLSWAPAGSGEYTTECPLGDTRLSFERELERTKSLLRRSAELMGLNPPRSSRDDHQNYSDPRDRRYSRSAEGRGRGYRPPPYEAAQHFARPQSPEDVPWQGWGQAGPSFRRPAYPEWPHTAHLKRYHERRFH